MVNWGEKSIFEYIVWRIYLFQLSFCKIENVEGRDERAHKISYRTLRRKWHKIKRQIDKRPQNRLLSSKITTKTAIIINIQFGHTGLV